MGRLIQIKEAGGQVDEGASGESVLKTYTFFLRGGGEGSDPFEPGLCRTEADVLEKAHEILGRHPTCGAVDVYFGDTHLFRVNKAGSSA